MTMRCDEARERLSEWIDGDLAGGDAAPVSAHVDGCAACSALAADLRRIRDAARSLGPIAPPEHLALELAGRLRMEHPATADAAAPSSGMRQWFGLAAALVLVTLGAYSLTRWVPTSETPAASDRAADSASPADEATARVEAVVQELGAALEKALSDLQTLARDADRPAEREVASQLLANLTVIDGAIAESRLALATDPANSTARDSLLEALRRKVGVLQSTMTLINDLRLGDAQAAGRAVAAPGKKS